MPQHFKPGSTRTFVIAAVLFCAAGYLLYARSFRDAAPRPGASDAESVAASSPAPGSEEASETAAKSEASAAARHRALFKNLPEPTRYVEGKVYGDLDLREVQAALPDNLYWALAAPTKDPEILALREEEARLRNLEYGAVLSGNATQGEVDAYYDFREQLSRDYVEFAQYLLDHYGDVVPDKMVGLLRLTVKLHSKRLEQLPGERADASERRIQHEKAREAWQEQQAAFDK